MGVIMTIMKQVKIFVRKQKIKRNFAVCALCPEGENIFIKKTGETSFLMSNAPLAQGIIKTKSICATHTHEMTRM